MAVELASAYITLLPSMRGASKEIGKQLGGVDTSSAGKQIGSSLGSTIANGLGSLAKVGATIGATLAGVVTGVAAKGGIDRALAIENAQAKLKGLGHSAESVAGLMGDALKSVKGTAFGLGDAATVAASMSAAGVKQGSEMQKVLSTVADTAQISGRSLGDMGTIFGSVAARGKLQGDDMLQLMSSGVPVLQLLAKHLNITSAEVSDMVSKGKIDFQTFTDAMQEGFGGAAQAAGTTFTGALANVKAALGRIGASAATPVLNALRDVFNGLIPVIDQTAAALQPLFDALSSKLAAATPVIVSGLQTIGDKIAALGSSGGFGALVPLLSALGPLVLGFAAPLLSNLPVIGGLLKGISPAFGGVLGIFAAMVASSPALQSALVGLLSALAQLVQAVLPSLTPLLGLAVGLIQVAAGVLAAVIEPLTAVIGWLGGMGDLLGSVAVGVLAGVGAWKAWTTAVSLWQTVTKVATAIQGAFNAVMSANPIMLIVIAIAAVVAALIWFFTQTETGRQMWASFMQWLGEAWQNIVNVATTVWTAIADFFTGLWQGIVTGVTTAWNAILAFLTPVFNVIGTIISTYVTVWKNIFIILAAVLVTIWNGIVTAVTWAWNLIVSIVSPIVQAIVDTVTAAVNTVQAIWSAVWGAVSAFFIQMWQNMVAFFTPIIQTIQSVIASVLGAISAVWNSVWGAVSGFFSGIWNGMVSAVSGAISRIAQVVGTIFNAVMGPLRSAGSWLVDVGKNIIEGLINGIGGAMGWLKDKISGMANSVIDWAKSTLGIHSPSRVFRFEVGQMVGEGMALGINDSEATVRSSMDALLAVPDVSGPSGAGTSPAIAGDTTTGVTPGGYALANGDLVIQGLTWADVQAQTTVKERTVRGVR